MYLRLLLKLGRIQIFLVYDNIMWLDNPIVRTDLEYIISVPFIDWSEFRDKSFFITGGTGLIGTTLVNALVYANKTYNLNLSITLLVRNIDKAVLIFSEQMKCCSIRLIKGEVESFSDYVEPFDFIIHGASSTSSKAFCFLPVETIRTAVSGTMNLLELAKKAHVKSFVYLSSMEVYGTPLDDEKVFEERHASIDLCEPRSSYPASKCLSEVMCVSYSSEYNVPAKIIRLTQTLGPGVSYNDQRVFAEFARCAIEGRNIVLATKGETRRNYIYTADAVTAILTVLLKGKIGQAYNAANENTYCSIKEMADFVAKISDQGISVVIDENIGKNRGFAPVLHMNLDTYKLRNIGWYPSYGLKQMYNNLIKTMHNN